MWRAGRMRLPRASPHRSRQLSLPSRIPIGGGGHGQQPRQPGEVEPGGRVLPHGESGPAAASEGSAAGLRHTPRYYDTSHTPGIALDCCQDCCQDQMTVGLLSPRQCHGPRWSSCGGISSDGCQAVRALCEFRDVPFDRVRTAGCPCPGSWSHPGRSSRSRRRMAHRSRCPGLPRSR